MTGYELSRQWFDWSFENTDLINPNHTALYFFIIEHHNRMGQPDKFGLPMEMAKEAIGIKNYRTYSKTFEDLINWGFIKVYQRSKNQYNANVIGLVKNTKATTKALSKATLMLLQKQSQSIVGINKPITLEPNNHKDDSIESTSISINSKSQRHNTTPPKKKEKIFTPETELAISKIKAWVETETPRVLQMRSPFTKDHYVKITQWTSAKTYTKEHIGKTLRAMNNWEPLLKKNHSSIETLRNWLDRDSKQEDITKKESSPTSTIKYATLEEFNGPIK